MPTQISAFFVSDSSRVEVVIDGTDFFFFLLTATVEIGQGGNLVSLIRPTIQKYRKTNLFERQTYLITKDFVVVTTMVQALRRFTRDDEGKLSFLMVYSRRDPQMDSEFGSYPYRLESIGTSDTTQSTALLSYDSNKITFSRDMGYLVALELKKEAYIVRQNFDPSLVSKNLDDWSIQLRGNVWSLSEKSIPAGAFIEVEELKPKTEEESDEDSRSIFLYVGFAALVLAIVIFSLVICYALRKSVKDIDTLESEKILSQSFLSQNGQSGHKIDESCPED